MGDNKLFHFPLSNMYPMGDAKEFSENMFRVFDLNNDNRIDFREFVIALSVYSKVSIPTSLKFVKIPVFFVFK